MTDRLKPGWRMVKFGDVVKDVKVNVDRDNCPYDRYIAGEHMQTEDLHIRKWGEIGQDYLGPAFHRRFLKGQILYGSRRTYLKKVAIAHFDGITANTTFVFESKDTDVLLQELLPFIMLTDSFTEHSIRESKGSTNPYITWPDLAKYEFPLPPMDEQRRITEILWAADEVVVSYQKVFYDFGSYFHHKVEDMLNGIINRKNYSLAEVLTESPESGCSASPSSNETGHYVLSLAALSSEGYVPGNLKSVELSSQMRAAQLKNGDLLISRSNTIEFVGFAGIFSEDRDDVSFPDTMMRLPVNKSIIYPEYLELLLLSSIGRKHMMKVASGTSDSMKKINRRTLGEFQFPLPNKEKQKQMLDQVSFLRIQKGYIAKHIKNTRSLLFRLLNEQIH